MSGIRRILARKNAHLQENFMSLVFHVQAGITPCKPLQAV